MLFFLLLKNIEAGNLLISKPTGESFSDLSIDLSVALVSNWKKLDTNDYILLLTNNGEKRWEQDDFGIATKRAQHLMF